MSCLEPQLLKSVSIIYRKLGKFCAFSNRIHFFRAILENEWVLFATLAHTKEPFLDALGDRSAVKWIQKQL